MRILITGAHGLLGSTLTPALRKQGHEVVPLLRGSPHDGPRAPRWDPATGQIDLTAAGDLDAVIHLAGENLASGRWTAARKAAIRDSRVQGTTLLVRALCALPRRPRVLLSASATGYYGDRGTEVLTESSSPGTGFLADVCQAWEAATTPATDAGIRVVLLRFGVVLSAQGGALAKMLTPFKFGLGGPLGSGDQFWSWIGMKDLVRAVDHLLTDESAAGPFNLVAPQPVTNHEFTKTLGHVIHRPTALRVPRMALRLALGEMADEALLASVCAEPRKLLTARFEFQQPSLREALESDLRGAAA